MRILIVDDEPATGFFLQSIIKEVPGVITDIATSGKEALKKASINQPQAVFLDIDMPDINGIELAHILAERYEDLSLVFATAHPDHALEAFELYSVDYILKPFDEERIKKTVKKLKDKSNLYTLVEVPIPIKTKKQKVFLKPSNILYIMFFFFLKLHYLVLEIYAIPSLFLLHVMTSCFLFRGQLVFLASFSLSKGQVVERLNREIRRYSRNLAIYSVDAINSFLEKFQDYYNHQPHESLGYLTPAEVFRKGWHNNHPLNIELINPYIKDGELRMSFTKRDGRPGRLSFEPLKNAG